MKKGIIRILLLVLLITALISEQFGIISLAAGKKTKLVIVNQPKSSYSANGDTVSIKVVAKGDGLKYQWWIKNTDSSDFYKSSIKSNTYNTKMDKDRNGRKLYCEITDRYGKKIKSKTVSINMIKKLSILKQPQNTDYYIDQKTDVIIEADGENLKYQWWVKNSGTNKFYKSSITSKKYVTKMSKAANGRKLYCVVSDSYGNKIISKTVTLGLKNKLAINKQPISSNYLSGETISIKVQAEGDGLKYQWWYKNVGSNKFYKSSIKSSRYTAVINEERNGRYLYCQVTDKYGYSVVSEIVSINLINNKECIKHKYGAEIPVCNNSDRYKFEKNCVNCGAVKSVYYDAMITFVDDDGKADALYHWERIMDATGIRVTSAIIPSMISEKTEYKGYWSYAGWDDINRLKKKGMEFVNHTYNHKNLTKLTKEEIIADFEASKQNLKSNGIESDILVYPNTAYNDTLLETVPQYFKAAVACGGTTNKPPFNNLYKINRINLNTSAVTKEIEFGDNKITCNGIHSLDKLKNYANKSINEKSWLVFMTHAYSSPSGKTYFDDESEQTVIDFCRYAIESEKIKFATLTEGVELITAYN